MDSLLLGYLIVAALVIGAQTLDGFFQGFARKAFGILAIILGIVAGWFGASLVGGFLEQWIPYPRVVLDPIGGAALGLLVYLAVNFLAYLLFPKASTLPDTGARIRSGIGGALLGALVGFFWMLLITAGIKAAANFAEPIGNTLKDSRAPKAGAISGALDKLIALRDRIQELPTDRLVEAINPVSQDIYQTYEKAIRVAKSPEALEALKNDPQAQAFVQDPAFQDVTSDAEIVRLAKARDIDALLRNPKVKALLDAPRVRELLRRKNIDAALDRALEHADRPIPR